MLYQGASTSTTRVLFQHPATAIADVFTRAFSANALDFISRENRRRYVSIAPSRLGLMSYVELKQAGHRKYDGYERRVLGSLEEGGGSWVMLESGYICDGRPLHSRGGSEPRRLSRSAQSAAECPRDGDGECPSGYRHPYPCRVGGRAISGDIYGHAGGMDPEG